MEMIKCLMECRPLFQVMWLLTELMFGRLLTLYCTICMFLTAFQEKDLI